MHDETDPMTAERVAAAYDHIAADYAVINAAMPPNLAELATRFLARLGPGTRALDVGCGEWLNLWAHEIPDVTGVGRIGPAMELATVPGIHEELDGAA